MPTCKICGSEVTRFIKSTNQWWSWCSNRCMGSDPETIAKKKQSNLKKFGATHPMHLDSVKEKLKQTFQENYGVDNPSKSQIVKNKMKDTFQKNHGVDNPSKKLEIVEKIKNSAIQRYQVAKQDLIQKRRETFVKTIGVASNKHLHIPTESIQKMKDLEWLKDQHFNQEKSCQQIADELGISPTPILVLFAANGINVKRHNISGVEKNVKEFIQSITNDTIVSNDRTLIKPQELDILIPSKNLAIEVNGIYWHAAHHGKDQNYHLSKTKACESQGIKLIQMYDAEWNNPIKQPIVKSKLKHLFGLSTKIHARKCDIVVVSSPTADQFLTENHLQGKCPSKYRVGLVYNGDLVSLATVGVSRFNRNYRYELLRYCNKVNYSVVGGLSKVLKHLENYYNVDSLISYADRRWTSKAQSNLYSQSGFKFLQESAPNYKYFNIFENSAILYSRNQFQKHMLQSKLEKFDPNLSESENMYNNGYFRIWDCGNLVYSKGKNESPTS